jgi:hypothetical protein
MVASTANPAMDRGTETVSISGLCQSAAESWTSTEAPSWMLSSHAQANFFHSPEWTRVLSETYGLIPAHLVRCAGDQPQTFIPFLECRIPLGRKRGVCLPFSDECPPLLQESENVGAVWGQVIQHARERSWRSVEIRGASALLRHGTPSLTFFGHTLDLAKPEKILFDELNNAVRRAIRKAGREGVTGEISTSSEAVKTYYDLHCRTRKRQGLPPQPFRLFRKIYEHVLASGLGFVVTARHQGAPIAGAIFFKFKSKALFKFGASDRSFQHLRGNDWVMWEAIKWLIRSGCKSLDFGRTSEANLGLRRFKLGWGAKEREIQYYKYDLNKAAFVADKDRAYGWHNRFFSLAPAWLARWAGSLLYGQSA